LCIKLEIIKELYYHARPNKSQDGASSWFYYRNTLRCTAPWTSNGTRSHYYCPDIQHMAFYSGISMFLVRSPGMLCHANWKTVTTKQCAAYIEYSGTGKYWYTTDMDDRLTIVSHWEWLWHTVLWCAVLCYVIPLTDGAQRACHLTPRSIGTVRSRTPLQIDQSNRTGWLISLFHTYIKKTP
jgi:hypothetical protein